MDYQHKYPNMPFIFYVLLRDFAAISTDPNEPASVRAYFHTILEMMKSGCADCEQIISAAQQHGYRLPDFDGDQMGRPADDYQE